MKHIHFIVNSIAGKGNNNLDLVYLESYFNKEAFTINIQPTSYKKHAIKLTQDSISEQADIIVACGGDGTPQMVVRRRSPGRAECGLWRERHNGIARRRVHRPVLGRRQDDLCRSWQGRADLGYRRQRVHRLPPRIWPDHPGLCRRAR